MGGDKPIGLAIGIVTLAAFILLPALVVPIFYVFANVYGLITGTDFSSDTMNVAVFLTGLVLIVTLLVVAALAGVSLVGRAITPRKRKT